MTDRAGSEAVPLRTPSRPSGARPFDALPRAAVICGVAILALASVVCVMTGLPPYMLTRDPAAIAELPPYAGFLSYLAVLSWAGAFFTAAFAASACRDVRDAPGFFGSIAVLSLVLCSDDLFMIHEHSPIPEQFLFLGYGIAAAWIGYRHAPVFRSVPLGYLGLTVGCLAASLGVDALQGPIEAILGETRILLEDGAKLVGAIAWYAFVFTAARVLVPSREAEGHGA